MRSGSRVVRSPLASLLALFVCFALALPADAAEQTLPLYRVNAHLSLEEPHVTGTVEVTFTNHSDATLTEAVFLLFPNRFAHPAFDRAVNDFNRPYVYPSQDFDPGGMELVGVLEESFPARIDQRQLEESATGVVTRVAINPMKPGDSRTLTVRFRTRVPERFRSFGKFEDRLTLVGGWYP